MDQRQERITISLYGTGAKTLVGMLMIYAIYDVTSQLIFNMGHNRITPDNAKATLAATKYISENSGDEVVIFYVHCTHGKDRTGVQSATYLVNQYLQANGSHIDKEALKNLISEGFVRWDGDDNLPANGYNVGKTIYSSSFYETLANTKTSEHERIFPNIFSGLSASDWQAVVPNKQNDLKDPAINEYAFNSPLCKDGYGLDKCLTFANGDHHKISWKKSAVNLNADLSHYKFQVAYIDSKGLPIDLETVNPAYNGDVASFTLETLNINEKYESIKLYVTDRNGSPISETNKAKYQYVASMTTPSKF